MKYLPELSHDTVPLSCSTGNRANVLHRASYYQRHPQYEKVTRFHQYSSIQSQWGQLWMNCARLETIMVLV